MARWPQFEHIGSRHLRLAAGSAMAPFVHTHRRTGQADLVGGAALLGRARALVGLGYEGDLAIPQARVEYGVIEKIPP